MIIHLILFSWQHEDGLLCAMFKRRRGQAKVQILFVKQAQHPSSFADVSVTFLGFIRDLIQFNTQRGFSISYAQLVAAAHIGETHLMRNTSLDD